MYVLIMAINILSLGPPHHLCVKPERDLELENGSAPMFNVEVLDVAGNVTTENKLLVTCKVSNVYLFCFFYDKGSINS